MKRCGQVQALSKAWFADKFEETSFKLSMGDIALPNASYKTLCAFLAQGVALLACHDEQYMFKLVETYSHLKGMVDDLKPLKDKSAEASGLAATLLGTIIEYANNAAVEVLTDG